MTSPVVFADGFAFPSGHATQAMLWVALALVLAGLIPPGRGRMLLVAGGVLVALAVGLTRVLLRVHFLTDVLAGWAFGAMLLASCAAVWVLALRAPDLRRSRRPVPAQRGPRSDVDVGPARHAPPS